VGGQRPVIFMKYTTSPLPFLDLQKDRWFHADSGPRSEGGKGGRGSATVTLAEKGRLDGDKLRQESRKLILGGQGELIGGRAGVGNTFPKKRIIETYRHFYGLVKRKQWVFFLEGIESIKS